MHRSRTLIAVLAAVLAQTVLAPAAAAAGAGASTPACPETLADDEFDDVADGSTHEHAVDCLAWWGISVGGNDARYGAGAPVTRGQIATFLARTLATTGASLPATPPMPYSDVPSGHPHRLAVAQLAANGIVRPVSGDQFRPGEPLRRDDMAVALVATYRHRTGGELPAAPDRFADLAGHPDRETINAAAALGFTAGTASGTYDPSGTVTRAQMASFLTRALGRVVGDGLAPVPTKPAWGTVPPGRLRYLPLPTAPTSTYKLFPEEARWNPCRTIHVVADYTDAPGGAEPVVKTALARVSAATGLRFAYRSATGYQVAQASKYNDGMVDGLLVVNWPEIWDLPRHVAGWGGYSASYSFENGKPGPSFITAGRVSINRDMPMTVQLATTVMMHELGHAIGLDHPDARDQVMSSGSSAETWRAGDLAGLARVGRAAGCPPQPFR